MISKETLVKRLKTEKKVALFIHVRPDGDCVGSGLALKLALESAGVPAEVFCSDPVPERFFFLEEAKLIKRDFSPEGFSAFVAVDCADIFRLGEFAEAFRVQKNTYEIDHHISNTHFSRHNYVIERGANCENVMELIEDFGVTITDRIANLLMTGIMTDTGNFRHKNVTPDTLYKSGKLLAAGADMNKIAYYMFSAQSKERAKLFGLTMSAIRYFEEGKIAVASVRREMIEKTGARADETEGFIDFVMGVRGVEVGACVMEIEKDKFKVSLRSKNADVNAVAGVFGGGGHVLASGCQIFGEYEEVVDRLVCAIKRFI